MYATLRIASWSTRHVWVALAVSLLALPSFAPAAPNTWIGIVGNWSDGTQWSYGVKPDAGTDTLIDVPAFVTLNEAGFTRDLTLDNISIVSSGTQNLTVGGYFNWIGGTMGGPGSTILNGTATANSISGATPSLTSGRVLVNNGTTNLTGTASLFADSDASLTNNGTFNINTTSNNLRAFDNNDVLPTPFVNASGATLARTSGPATTIFAWSLDNSGTVDIASGTTLRFEGGGILKNNGQTTGAGTFRINGSTMTVGSLGTDVFTFGATGGTTTRMDGGTLTGPGQMVFAGDLDWTNGTLSGNGTTELRGSNNRMRSNSFNLSRAVVGSATSTTSLEGGITVTGSGTPWTNNGTFRFLDNGTLGSSGTFTNNGLLLKTNATAGASTLAWTLNNAGTVRAENGTLTLSGAVTNTGTLQANSGATVSVTGSYTQTAGQIVANGGTVTLTGTSAVQGGLSGTGTINGGTINHSNGSIAPGSSIGNLTIAAANFNLSPSSILAFEFNTTIPDQVVTGDHLQVNGNLTLDGTINISGSMPALPGKDIVIIDYTGTLVNNILEIGTVPVGDKSSYFVDATTTPGKVVLHLPEPSTLVLGISLGLMGLVLAWRKRKAVR